MKQYFDVVREIMSEGTQLPNRTGIDTISIDGAMMRFNLVDGFPALTTKRLAFKSVVGELCAFLRASRSAADFRALGCKVWDANANGEGKPGSPNAWLTNPYRKGPDDLGPVYGVQWREWPGFKMIDSHDPSYAAVAAKLEADGWEKLMDDYLIGDIVAPNEVWHKEIDQLADCVRKIIKDPTNRRILFHGWNPAALDEVALPACHLLYQFLPNAKTRKLNMTLYVRSNDIGLGSPFNIAEGAALVHAVARLTGFQPGRLTVMVGDAHIYVNQLDYLNEQMEKEPFPLPELKLSDRIPSFLDLEHVMPTDAAIEEAISWLKRLEPSDFELVNYQYHTLTTPTPEMAV